MLKDKLQLSRFKCRRNLYKDGPEQRVHSGQADLGGPGHDLPVHQAHQRHLGTHRSVHRYVKG